MEHVAKSWPRELTNMKLTVSTAPLLSCLICDGKLTSLYKWQNAHLLTTCVQQIEDSSNVERQ